MLAGVFVVLSTLPTSVAAAVVGVVAIGAHGG
jgi:hypothetical protein